MCSKNIAAESKKPLSNHSLNRTNTWLRATPFHRLIPIFSRPATVTWKSAVSLLLGALLTGLILVFSLPSTFGLYYWVFLPLGLTIWFYFLLTKHSLKAHSSFTFVMAFVFFSVNLLWAWESMGYFLPWLAFTLLMSLFFLAVPVILDKTPKPLSQSAVFLAGLFTMEEAWRSSWPWGGAAWPILAWSQVDSPIGAWASWAGESGTLFIIALLSAVTAKTLHHLPILICRGSLTSFFPAPAVTTRISRKTLSFRWSCALILGLLPSFLAAVGFNPSFESHLQDGSQQPTLHSLRVSLVQGNVHRPIASDFNTPYQIFRNNLTAANYSDLKKSDLILLGEQAAEDPRQDGNSELLLNYFQIQSGDKPVLFGTAYWQTTRLRVNETLLLTQKGIVGNYVKQRPVPFGEYLPARKVFETLFPPVKSLIPVDMRFGTKPGIIPVQIDSGHRPVKVGVNICFETAIESIVNDSVKQGAEFLWVPTNNASFGDYGQAQTQLLSVRFRAQEYQRASAQVSLNGVSAFVDPNGKVRAGTETKLFTANQKSARISLEQKLTPAIWIAPALHNTFKYLLLLVVSLVVVDTVRKATFAQNLKLFSK